MKIIASLLFIFFPLFAVAHEGHATQGSFLHSYEHGVWAFAVVLIILTTLLRYFAKERKKY